MALAPVTKLKGTKDILYNSFGTQDKIRVTSKFPAAKHVILPSYVPAGNIKSPGQVGQGETFIDWANVCHPVAGINDYTSQKTLRIQRQDGLDGDVCRVKPVLK